MYQAFGRVLQNNKPINCRNSRLQPSTEIITTNFAYILFSKNELSFKSNRITLHQSFAYFIYNDTGRSYSATLTGIISMTEDPLLELLTTVSASLSLQYSRIPVNSLSLICTRALSGGSVGDSVGTSLSLQYSRIPQSLH